jgi:hypothetical protein
VGRKKKEARLTGPAGLHGEKGKREGKGKWVGPNGEKREKINRKHSNAFEFEFEI